MKVHVLYDREGAIISMSRSVPVDPEAEQLKGRPVPGPGQSAAELDLPGDMDGERLSVLHGRLRVENRDGSPRLARR